MKSENRLWGVPCIRGELLKLGIKLAESTIRKLLRQNGFDPATHRPSLSWWEFIKRHKKAWACDFFTVETVFLQTLYVFVVIEVHSRALIGIRVIAEPSPEWVRNTIIDFIGFDEAPGLLIRDGDILYDWDFKPRMQNPIEHVVKTLPESPKANAFAERVIGSIQRECSDHHLFFGQKHLQSTLNDYQTSYVSQRPHQGIDQKIPAKPIMAVPLVRPSNLRIAKTSFFSGLHHSYHVAG